VTDDDWDALVRDLAARVAVYAPDWTQRSDSDPGITIVELFAFLGESLLDRAERVPELRSRLRVELARLERLAARDRDDATLVRVRFFAGQLLSAADFEQEQDYLRARHRRHNRLLHGAGIVWGLDVVVDDHGSDGSQVVVSPGVAIAADGEEVVLCDRTTSLLPPEPTACYVSLGLAERATGTQPDGEATRIEEFVEITVSEAAPPSSMPIARLVREHDAWTVDPTFPAPRSPR
jgi:hypothetical protein